MLRTMTLALALVGAASPAAAGSWSWGVGVGFGPPIYWGPPPVYYDPPVVYVPAPPPAYYDRAPAVGYGEVDPGAILDALDAAGYSELSPMRRRAWVYELTALDPDGSRVGLEISARTGEIERERILEGRYEEPPVVAPAPRPPRRAAASPEAPASPSAAPSSLRDRLQAQAVEPDEKPADGEGDPLVIY